jgi:hypothetical protein
MNSNKKVGIILVVVLLCAVGYFGFISTSDDSPNPVVPSNYPSNITESNSSLVSIEYTDNDIVYIKGNNQSVESIYLSFEGDDLYQLSEGPVGSIELSGSSEYGVVVEVNGVKYKAGTVQAQN